MMDALYLIKILLGVAGFAILVILAFLLLEVLRIAVTVRKMVNRFAMLTDAKTWINLAKKIVPLIRRTKE